MESNVAHELKSNGIVLIKKKKTIKKNVFR